MGLADRSYGQRPRGGGGGIGFGHALTPWVKRLLIANGAVYLLVLVELLPFGWAVRNLGFSAGEFLTHPWTPITYMFVHAGFWHLLFNMIGLYFFGPPLERTWGGDAFIRFYVVAGLGGVVASALLVPLLGSSYLIGASGAIYGLLLAFAMTWPEAPVYIWGLLPIRAKWFVAILAGIAFLSTLSATGGGGGGIAHWAHLGGLVAGFVYLKFGDRIGEGWHRVGAQWDRVRQREGDATRGDTKRSDRRRLTVTRGMAKPERPGRRPRRSREGADGDTLDEVDRILDKIREDGIESLNPQEREFLDEMSRRYRRTP